MYNFIFDIENKYECLVEINKLFLKIKHKYLFLTIFNQIEKNCALKQSLTNNKEFLKLNKLLNVTKDLKKDLKKGFN